DWRRPKRNGHPRPVPAPRPRRPVAVSEYLGGGSEVSDGHHYAARVSGNPRRVFFQSWLFIILVSNPGRPNWSRYFSAGTSSFVQATRNVMNFAAPGEPSK